MLARRTERLPKQGGLSRVGRWASVLALVAGMSGVSAAMTEASPLSTSRDADVQRALVGRGSTDALVGLRPELTPFSAVAADDEADNEEMEDEEFEEDGIRATGQSEQRDQKKNDRSETKNEDSTNQTD